MNFNNCRTAMEILTTSTDLSCTNAPSTIPAGVDTQLGTGINPIVGTGNDAGASFGGLTNDPVPSGNSNIMIPGFLVHGPAPAGERTVQCPSAATCGTNINNMTITHLQNFRSVPSGQVINPPLPGFSAINPAATTSNIRSIFR